MSQFMNACRTLSRTPNCFKINGVISLLSCIVAVCCFSFGAGAANLNSVTKTPAAKADTPRVSTTQTVTFTAPASGRLVERVMPAPVISSFSPSSGAPGTLVSIEGNNLDSLTTFTIGGVPTVLISKTNTKVVGLVTTGAVNGPVSITTPGGTANSATDFTVTATGSFLPTTAGPKLSYTPATNSGQGFTVTIAADGKTLAVGAPSYDAGQGAVIVYALADTGWVQQALLTVANYKSIGLNLTISADGNSIGTTGKKLNNPADLILFTRSGTNWTSGYITIGGTPTPGNSILFSGDGKTVVTTSEPYNIGTSPMAKDVIAITQENGVVSSSKIWRRAQTTNGAGLSISADGNTIMVHRPRNPGDDGGVVVYTRTNGVWAATGTEIYSYNSGLFIGDLSLSGDGLTAVVKKDNILTFIRTGTDTWIPGPTIPGANTANVSVSFDGTLALVSTGNSADYYKLSGGSWINMGHNNLSSEVFSSSLMTNGTKAAFGFANDNGNIGSAQVFNDVIANITSFSPASGPTGTIVTINGSGLEGLTPLIGGKPAIILSANNNVIKALVTGTTTGKITFKENAASSTGNFTITPQPLPTNLQNAKLGPAEGSSIALSANGNTMVVRKLTTPAAAGPGGRPDTSVVYKRKTNGSWYKYANLLAGPTQGGYRISADGSTILSPYGILADNGDGTYTQQLALTGLDYIDGLALNASGDLAIVPITNGTGVSLIPYIRSNDTWQQGASFTKAQRKLFGSVLALSADGTTLLVGDYGDNDGYDTLGVYVYIRTGNTFVEQRRLPSSANGLGKDPVLGVSSDGNTVIVNIVSALSPGFNVPVPIVYTRNGNSWVKTSDFPSDGNTTCNNCYAGISFSADGTTVLAGNRLYKANGSAWNLAAVLDNTFNDVGGTKSYPGPRSGQIPYFSALSADGSTAVLGQTAYYDSGVKVFASTVTYPPAVTPTASATKLVFTNTTFNSTTVSWTNGNGAKRAVFIAKTANGVAAPVNNTTYTANTAFGTGTQIGSTGWYAIYNGDGNSVNITGLASSTTYRVTVVEYNGVSGDEKYLLQNLAPASIVTTSSPNDPPTIQASALNFINTTSSSTTVRWTSGNGANRAVFVAKTANGVAAPVDDVIYTANAAFGSGTQIGSTGWYCVYNGTGNSADVSGLLSSTNYRVTVVEYNGTASVARYMTTKLAPANVVTLLSPAAAPTIPSLKLTYSNITPGSATVSWTSGNGAKRAVFVAIRGDGVANALDNTTYTANANFGGGTQVGSTGWYCVYNGTGNSANITGLASNTTYRTTVIEYNGDAGSEKYMNTKLSPASVTTASETPTVPALKLTFNNTTSSSTNVSWASGNGAMRAVFVARTANGVANAVDNTTYTANSTFGAGTQIGSTGWYCVYNGSGNNANINGLDANVTYRVTVIEYNGGTGAQLYMNTKLNPASFATIPAGPVAPTQPSLNLNFTNTTNNATTVNWTSGNGFRRAVFVARRGDGVASPFDNTTYAGNPIFATGTQIGTTGWYCVYDGTASSADITGLSAATIYRVTVVEYNGTSGSEKYMLTKLAPASFTTTSGSGLHATFASLKTDVIADDETQSEIEASNLLSPNGDGKNDTWVVKNIEQYKNNTVTVFDQGSNIIYTKNGYTNDWAGTYRGGVVKEGTYYYLISLGNGTTKKGFITVLSSRQ